MLAKPASEISVGDILRALEGNLDAVNCPGLEEDGFCEGSEYCVTKYVWQKINESINRTVDEIKLDQLIQMCIRDRTRYVLPEVRLSREWRRWKMPVSGERF